MHWCVDKWWRCTGYECSNRAVVRKAISNGVTVKGIKRGYAGLLNEEIVDMQKQNVSDIIQRGGTILGTALCLEFKEPDVQAHAADICRKHGIDGLVVIGGDGLIVVRRHLQEMESIPLVFLVQSTLILHVQNIPLDLIQQSTQRWKPLIR